MGSTRYPGKVMENLKGNNKVLDYVVKQLKFSKSIENLIIATTTLEQDDVIVKYAKKNTDVKKIEASLTNNRSKQEFYLDDTEGRPIGMIVKRQ